MAAAQNPGQIESQYWVDYYNQWTTAASMPGVMELNQPGLIIPMMPIPQAPVVAVPVAPVAGSPTSALPADLPIDYTATYINGPLSVETSRWSTRPRTGGAPYDIEQGHGILMGFYMTPMEYRESDLSTNPDEWRCVYGKITRHKRKPIRARTSQKKGTAKRPAAPHRYTIVMRISKYTYEHEVAPRQGTEFVDGDVVTMKTKGILPLKRFADPVAHRDWMVRDQLAAALYALKARHDANYIAYRELNRKHVNTLRLHGPNVGTLRAISTRM